MTIRRWVALCVAGLTMGWGAGTGLADGAEEGSAKPIRILYAAPTGRRGSGPTSLWRFRVVRESRELMKHDGAVMHGEVAIKGDRRERGRLLGALTKDQPYLDEELYEIRVPRFERYPADTPANWFATDYDDSHWIRRQGPVLSSQRMRQSSDLEWKMIFARNWFHVENPARVKDLTLDVEFMGGAVVYVNGKAVARRHLPEGDLDVHAAAEAYPEEAYFGKDGWPMTQRQAGMAHRLRKIESLTIPASALRKGPNLIAIAIHRAPTRLRYLITRSLGEDGNWKRIGLMDVRLTVAADAGVQVNDTSTEVAGFHVWNQNVLNPFSSGHYPDRFTPLRPVRLAGARNDRFSGQVVIGSDQPIRGLRVEATDLSGAGTIPAAAVQTHFGGLRGNRYDILDTIAPEEVPLLGNGHAMLPVWVSVTVPRDAAPGAYAGAVTLHVEGQAPRPVPIELTVADWTMPDVDDIVSILDIAQSPESVALAYDVPLWSDEHFKLLDQTFALLGEMATKSIYITAIRRTHWGNEHAMVRWVRDEEGELHPDFSIVERYLDTAMKHLGNIPMVILYAWEGQMTRTASSRMGNIMDQDDRDMLITGYDPDADEMYDMTGPAWSTPEAKVISQRLSSGMIKLLQARGIEDSLLFGLIGDARPTRPVMDVIVHGVENPKWVMHSHHYATGWQGHAYGACASVWGVPFSPGDPRGGYGLGWSNPFRSLYYPREMGVNSSLPTFHIMLERWMSSGGRSSWQAARGRGTHGLGRMGADFWPVLEDGRGNITRPLRGRYPETEWGPLALNLIHVLGQGQRGPVPTMRSEAMRKGVQLLAARIYLDKALLDEEAEARLGAELMERCQRIVHDRVRLTFYGSGTFDSRVHMAFDRTNAGEIWLTSGDMHAHAAEMYALAAEVAKKLGRDPVPNLK